MTTAKQCRPPHRSHRFGRWLLLAGMVAAAPAQAPELRGVWVARDSLTSRAKIVQTLDQLAAANLNLVAVNCWSRGYTIHPSDVLFATCGVRQDPDPAYVDRDPLAEFVLEAHRRGIEVEAWLEYGFMFGWSGWHAGPAGQGPVLTANPGWLGRAQDGSTQIGDGGGGFYTWASHEHPQVRRFLLDLAVELAGRYDLDGIQLDRCRYPSTSWGYDPATSAAYLAATGQPPPSNVNQAAWMRWRADRLNAFHREFHAVVKAVRPSLRVTDAPTVWPGAYSNFLQDWPAWLGEGSLDLVYPQVYRTTVAAYTTTLDQQLAVLPSALRAKVAPGIRAISGTPTSEVLAMVAATRARNLPGQVFWYAEGLYDDLPALTANYFQLPAAVPLRPPGWRPPAVAREDDDPSTLATPGFVPVAMAAASGGQAKLALAGAAASDAVTYTLPVAATGLYALLAHVPSSLGLSAAAPCTVEHAGGTAVLAVDQRPTTAAGWRELGTCWLTAGSATVVVGARPGQAVAADAMALLRSRWPSGPIARFGTGTGGVAGGVRLSMHGRSGVGGRLTLQANRLPPGMPVVLGLALQGTAIPWSGGTLFVVPSVTVGGAADDLGVHAGELSIPTAPSLVGVSLFAQALALDATGPGGVSLSAGAATTIE